MSRLYKITDEDLAELEKTLPKLSESLMIHLTPSLRTSLRRCKNILSDVRWHYGPAEQVQSIPADEDG
ncbi:hypothetical protein Pan44_04380 [Caulifigura coniformis]|uniref:Uncharacterized protein n=1 Tax=Caulifigura coniformis TaxID=2527983 RepID=A0A517S8H6_9PLAN|nr:hypothetical protein [Caulifigura coniformis]QDT52427.1 hypothetical protein Pan44_04380 [Caulifigura coniformis]